MGGTVKCICEDNIITKSLLIITDISHERKRIVFETRGKVLTKLSDIFHRCCFVYLLYDLRVLLMYVSLFVFHI